MLLPLTALEGRLAETVSRWLQCVDNLRFVVDLYFGTIYEPAVHVSRHFFELAVAAEAYHKRSTQTKKRISYRNRVLQLCKDREEVIGKFIDPETFSEAVKTKRHALAHGGPGAEEDVKKGAPLIKHILQLRTLLEACFLHELGIPPDEAKERMKLRISMRKEGLYV